MSELSNKEKNWGALAHLVYYTSWFFLMISTAVYFAYYDEIMGGLARMSNGFNNPSFMIPIIILVMTFMVMQIMPTIVILFTKGQKYEFVGHQARECLNFVLSSWALILLLFVIFVVGNQFLNAYRDLRLAGDLIFFVSVVLAFFYVNFWPLVAALKASKGLQYRYPFSIRFI